MFVLCSTDRTTEQVLVLSFDSFDDFGVKMRRKAAHQAVSIRKAQKHLISKVFLYFLQNQKHIQLKWDRLQL